jgi:hypothetical protein
VGPVHTINYDDGVYDENLTKAHILKSILSKEKKLLSMWIFITYFKCFTLHFTG